MKRNNNFLLSRKARVKLQLIVIIAIVAVAIAAIGGAAYYLTKPGVTPPTTSPPATTAPPTSPPKTTPPPTTTPTPTATPTPQPTVTPTPTLTPTPQPTPTSTPTVQIYEVEDLKDLLALASEMSYRWTDSDGTQTDTTYRVVGEESVEGVTCWIVNGSIKSEKEDTFTVWVSKEDGTAKKVKMGDMEFTGDLAQQFWLGFGTTMMAPFLLGSSWHLWEMPYIVDPTYGTVQYLGSEQRTFGETSLTVNKYRFLPGAAWYVTDLDYVDYSLANVDTYMIMTYFKYTLKNEETGSFELLAIKLS